MARHGKRIEKSVRSGGSCATQHHINCGNTLKPLKPKRGDETSADVTAAKAEKISTDGIRLNPKCQ